MEPFFSKQQCGFCKGYSTQYCLLSMLEKWKSLVDKVKYFSALLTDLSKAFDCISRELILAKLHAYGFSLRALWLIHSYLTNRKQRARVNGNVHGKKSCLEFHKDLYSDLCFSIYFFVIFSWLWKKPVLQVMRMTIRPMLQPKILTRLLNH